MPGSYLSLSAYDKIIRSLIGRGEFERALVDVALKAERAKNEPLAFARIYGSPVLDHLCHALGQAVSEAMDLKSRAQPDDAVEHAIFVCTETVGGSGHARVISDLIRADPNRRAQVVFTNLWERNELFTEEFENLGAEITVLPKSSMFEKLGMLLRLLAAAPRSRVYLFNHHQDAVAVTAVAGSPFHPRFFVHHCDYQFCLGPYLPGAVHVDLHTTGFHRCRKTLNIDHNVYWPLTCQDGPSRHKGRFLRASGLTTCCCAVAHKVTANYPINYFDAITEVLGATGGTHIHIGEIDEANMRRLAANLARHKVDAGRFVHIPYVPSLRDALVEREVDVYLVSFPLGGGRAVIEAMAAGLPVVGHLHHRDKLLSAVDLLPSGAPVWTDVAELLAVLKQLTIEQLQTLSRASREHYEAHHTPQLLAACVANGHQPAPPPERCADVEGLQRILFERSFVLQAAKEAKLVVDFKYDWTGVQNG